MKITSQNKTESGKEANRARLFDLFARRPMPDEELLVNLGLFMRSGSLAKILFLDELYRMIVEIPGCIFEFGVWYGQSLVVLENLRAVHEPYNHQRRIIGFDTFSGYPEVGDKDRRSDLIAEGVYGVGDDYEGYLGQLIDFHEKENVMAHIKKHSTVKGDVRETLPSWFRENPQALVSLAYFDMALYEPTKEALLEIESRLIPGSVVAFDEFGHPDYPGETQAAMEILGGQNYVVRNSRILPDRVYFLKTH
jgi:hypothetical protein